MDEYQSMHTARSVEFGGLGSHFAADEVVDPDGAVMASTVPPAAAPCMHHPSPPPAGPHSVPPPPRDKPACYLLALQFPTGAWGHIEFRRTHPKPLSPLNPLVIGFVLLIVVVSSMFLARSVVRPLRKLATAARVLGGGDLTARADIDRTDELGEVARAFDDMASRVADLVRAEKELVANLSHELRTPLARIRVALDIASEGDETAIQESLSEITDDLAELERLVTDVVTAARLDLATDMPRGIPPLRKGVLPRRSEPHSRDGWPRARPRIGQAYRGRPSGQHLAAERTRTGHPGVRAPTCAQLNSIPLIVIHGAMRRCRLRCLLTYFRVRSAGGSPPPGLACVSQPR